MFDNTKKHSKKADYSKKRDSKGHEGTVEFKTHEPKVKPPRTFTRGKTALGKQEFKSKSFADKKGPNKF